MPFSPQAPEGESQPMTEVDLFISTQRIKVLNADTQVLSGSLGMKLSSMATPRLCPSVSVERHPQVLLLYKQKVEERGVGSRGTVFFKIKGKNKLWMLFGNNSHKFLSEDS